jgi:hypothetical protein
VGGHDLMTVTGDVDCAASRALDAQAMPITVVLQRCYSGVRVWLQWCYSGITAVLQWS